MHFLMHLLRYFPFVVIEGTGGGDDPPAGFVWLVEQHQRRIVTSRGSRVIAKDYVN